LSGSTEPAHIKVLLSLLSDEDSLDDDAGDDNNTGHDTDPLEDQSEAEAKAKAEPEDAIQATLPKTERTADICTVFTCHDTHWVCNPCKYVIEIELHVLCFANVWMFGRDAGEPESKHIF
jgi:hypothetical protein